jgi:hypothetical protein
MLFFQVALLAGYAWARWLIRQTATRQRVLQLVLLGLSLLALPILPSSRWKPAAGDPLPHILGLLAATIGLPYFLLAATGPLLQSWFSRSKPGARPYRLFALSNAGSMAGLLSYPVLVEPYLTNSRQAWLWSGFYVVFVALSAAISLRAASRIPISAESKTAPPPRLAERVLWMALAACPAALFLAITAYLTQDIAAMPLLWVLPLSLYLLSLMLCFESDRWYAPSVFALLGAVSLPLLAYAVSGNSNLRQPKIAIAVICLAAFVLFMMCHGELARRRPMAAHLTSFYLAVAAGGAAGGVFAGIAAPYLFDTLYDPLIVLSLTGMLLVWLSRPQRLGLRPKTLAALAALAAYCVLLMPKYGPLAILFAGLLAVCAFRASLGSPGPALYALAAGLAAGITGYLVQDVSLSNAGARTLARDFYGVLAVYDEPGGGSMGPVRVLRHGTIEHGEQFLLPQNQSHPTTYYARRSGAGLAIQALLAQPAIRVGVIGLGAGTLAAYARPGDSYCFYEIDPNVIRIAQSDFTFLRDAAAPPAIVAGDARLSLEREPSRQFDLLAVDAFSGDAVPVHLLTQEAFRLYWRHLKPDGVLAVHVTNRYLKLGPVVAAAAAADGRRAMMVAYSGDRRKNESASDWVLVTSRPGFFDLPDLAAAARPVSIAGTRAWTDDYSNLLSVLR